MLERPQRAASRTSDGRSRTNACRPATYNTLNMCAAALQTYDKKLIRLGLQTAIWQYARSNVRPPSASAWMLGA